MSTASPSPPSLLPSHFNNPPSIIHQRIQTALILEDDADWDFRLRSQLTDFARGMHYLTSNTSTTLYGTSWDLLSIGHTGINNRPHVPQNYWVSRDDPTVIPESRRTWNRKPILPVSFDPNTTRTTMRIDRLTGLAAYAVSLPGASKILFDQALTPNATAIDVGISALCRDDTLACYGAYPTIVGRYRAAGRKSRDSDRRTMSNWKEKGSGGKQSGDVRLVGESEFLVEGGSLGVGLGGWVREGGMRGEREDVMVGEGVWVGEGEYGD